MVLNKIYQKLLGVKLYTFLVRTKAHRINNFIEHACNSSLIISDLFSRVQELYVFFSSSTKRYGPLLKKLNEIEDSLKLKMYHKLDGQHSLKH